MVLNVFLSLSWILGLIVFFIIIYNSVSPILQAPFQGMVTLLPLLLRDADQVPFLWVGEGLWLWQKWCYVASLSKSKKIIHGFHGTLTFESWPLFSEITQELHGGYPGPTVPAELSADSPASICQPCAWDILDVYPLVPMSADTT